MILFAYFPFLIIIDWGVTYLVIFFEYHHSYCWYIIGDILLVCPVISINEPMSGILVKVVASTAINSISIVDTLEKGKYINGL